MVSIVCSPDWREMASPSNEPNKLVRLRSTLLSKVILNNLLIK